MPINCAIYNVVSRRGGGYSWHFVVGVSRPVLLTVTLFHTEKLSFSTLVFRPGAGRNYVIITYNGLKCKEKDFLKFISKRILLFFLVHLELKQQIRSYCHAFPRKPYPKSDLDRLSAYPFSDQNCAKCLSFGAADTYKANTRKYATPPGGTQI